MTRPRQLLMRPADRLYRRLTGTGDRAMKLLSLTTAGEAAESGAGRRPTVPASATLRDVLSELLWSGAAEATVVDADGVPCGRLTLAGDPRARAAELMPSVALGPAQSSRCALLVAFLLTPQSFAPLFAPLSQHGAPAIYDQGNLLTLALAHARHRAARRRRQHHRRRRARHSRDARERGASFCRCRARSSISARHFRPSRCWRWPCRSSASARRRP